MGNDRTVDKPEFCYFENSFEKNVSFLPKGLVREPTWEILDEDNLPRL